MSKVMDYLAGREVEFDAFEHPPTVTAVDEAHSLGVAPIIVAKTILLDTSGGHVLAVIAAPHRLDMKLTRRAVGDPHVRLASEKEMERDFPEFATGALPPFAALVSVPVYLDRELAAHETLVFAADETESVRIRTADLIIEGNVVIASLARPMDSFDEDWME